jgi:CMP/dCMP kinase
MIITIDGPAASGKSTLARMIADQLDIYYLNSGFLFRGLAYILVQHHGITPSDLSSVAQETIEESLAASAMTYQYQRYHGVSLRAYESDITEHLKTAHVDSYASLLGINRAARDVLAQLQRAIAQAHSSLVVEGRDAGSVVFPHAAYKFFITASLEIRAARWRADQQAKGHYHTPHDAVRIIQERDSRDSARSVAPLVIPPDALIIDTSNLSLSQALEKMLHAVDARVMRK